jgi:hypothetical protein
LGAFSIGLGGCAPDSNRHPEYHVKNAKIDSCLISFKEDNCPLGLHHMNILTVYQPDKTELLYTEIDDDSLKPDRVKVITPTTKYFEPDSKLPQRRHEFDMYLGKILEYKQEQSENNK